GFLAKLSVSALMFDYVLTGPISGVSAGSYLVGLFIQVIHLTLPNLYLQLGLADTDLTEKIQRYGAILIAIGITLYFLRQNLLGIHESSDKALKIMIATTIMAVLMLAWCGVTLVANRGGVNSLPLTPNLDPKVAYETITRPDSDHSGEEIEVWKTEDGKLVPKIEDGRPVPKENSALKEVKQLAERAGFHPTFSTQDDPLGFLGRMGLDSLRHPPNGWWSIIGLIGLFIAFGHSIL